MEDSRDGPEPPQPVQHSREAVAQGATTWGQRVWAVGGPLLPLDLVGAVPCPSLPPGERGGEGNKL